MQGCNTVKASKEIVNSGMANVLAIHVLNNHYQLLHDITSNYHLCTINTFNMFF